MTSTAAFRCVQAWLLEKPTAWADEDAPCLAAALMAQRPPYKRPREDALLEAERSHQQHLIAQLDEELLDETLRCEERERDNKNLRRMLGRHNEFLKQTRKRAVQAERRVGELEHSNRILRQRVERLGEMLSATTLQDTETIAPSPASNSRQRGFYARPVMSAPSSTCETPEHLGAQHTDSTNKQHKTCLRFNQQGASVSSQADFRSPGPIVIDES